MSRSHRDTTSSVSLFPFLAVLVCAMGALIFILLVTTHRLRQQAITQAEQKRRQQTTTSLPPEPILPSLAPLPTPNQRAPFIARPSPLPPVDPNIALRAAIARLSRERDDLRGNLNRRRQSALAIKQQQDAADAAIAQARSTLALIGHQQELERIAQRSLLKQQTGLIGQIRQADERLKTLRQQNATAESRYAVLPFDGKTGTTRRPILIECTRDGLRFLPEDVTLSREDLDGFTVGYNPLLAGTSSLIQYWSGFAGSARTGFAGPLRKRPPLPRDESSDRRHKPSPADEAKPYVLLIVRPGGSIPFYKARKYLARLGEPFGYELLESDHKLALSPVDPGAQATVQEAVDAVLAERARLIATIGRGGEAARRGWQTGGQGTRSGRSAAGGRSNRYGSGFGEQPGAGRIAGRGAEGPSPAAAGRGARSRSSASGKRNSRYGSGSGEQSGGGRIAGHRSAGRNPEAKGRRHASRSGEASGNPARPTEIPKQSTPISGRFGQRSSGRRQTGAQQSRNGAGTRSGRTAATSVGRPAGSHRAHGGNTSEPFPQFGQTAGAGSQAARMMHQPRRWGHAGGRTGIGFERNVAVTVGASRIAIGNRLIVPVGRGETRKQLIDQVAAAIDREARSWGPPPSGFYWVPSIQFEVLPGGNQFYERLNPAFRRWGLSTSARFPVGSSNDSWNGG